ncbi:multisubunit sodium/proton antiporter, MrpE subunit [Dethiosulfatibacter aminovorans DSM 17477]|uniref:Multisubunit sodium/proton antiporter, MrpE subunit n=1 Tax=Dethiosulfatibacter aminovorans DSM 17477 TaxID=1121476 RepID=A0A1M6FTM0_9FIRM|nr:Na+/H+ antiporter subunit E [Dethiosulfatibacter aminovorans]SHJ01038.1 multisubunit sodium/proton antiporter, MrpE subunit [Dethiosulfatibacter aminovorans DSM 17477]
MHNLIHVLLLGLWLVFAERFSIEVLLVGIFGVILVALINKKLVEKIRLSIGLKSIPYFFEYLFILLYEIIKANIHVAMLVLSPKPKLSPSFVKHRISLKSDLHRTILANSITLTPGTLTVSMEDDEMLIHCLTEEFGKSIEETRFEKILMKLEELYYD